MRALIDPRPDGGAPEVTEADLTDLYAAPSLPWLQVNMAASVDGAVTGITGRSDSINNEVDKQVFDALRVDADVVVVGAGTARIEGYQPNAKPLVVVSRSGRVPPTLRDSEPGRLLMATCEEAVGLAEARELLGEEQVLVLGVHQVDLVALSDALVARGWSRMLCEGGPHLLRDLLAAGVVDELCATAVPRLVGGLGPRITAGPPLDVELRLHGLLESDGTLLARWLVGVR